MKSPSNFPQPIQPDNSPKYRNDDEKLIEEKGKWAMSLYKREGMSNIQAGYGYGVSAPNPNYEERTLQTAINSQIGEFPKTTSITMPNGKTYDFSVEKGMVNPDNFSITYRVAKDFPYADLENKSFLEIGPGIGVQMVLVGERAKKVVGVELNPNAVQVASSNISRYSTKGNIEIRQGNMFEALTPEEKFDCIYFHIPYFYSDDVTEGQIKEQYADTGLYEAMYDKNYEALVRFIYSGRKLLNSSGYLLLLYSDSISMDTLNALIKDADMKEEVVKQYQSQKRKGPPLSFTLLKISNK